MNKSISFILSIIIFLLSGCTKSDKEVRQEKVKQENQKSDTVSSGLTDETFICRFHPLERQNGPGNCPICGAELVSLDTYNKEMARKNEEMKKKWKTYIGSVYLVIDLPSIKCSDCESIVVNSLMKDKGILDFQVDIVNKDVFLFFDPFKTKKENIENLLTDAGFDTKEKKVTPGAARNLPDCCK